MSVEVSEKEANYLQKRVDFGIQTGKEFFGFIKIRFKKTWEFSPKVN